MTSMVEWLAPHGVAIYESWVLSPVRSNCENLYISSSLDVYGTVAVFDFQDTRASSFSNLL